MENYAFSRRSRAKTAKRCIKCDARTVFFFSRSRRLVVVASLDSSSNFNLHYVALPI